MGSLVPCRRYTYAVLLVVHDDLLQCDVRARLLRPRAVNLTVGGQSLSLRVVRSLSSPTQMYPHPASLAARSQLCASIRDRYAWVAGG